jgi:hypothetical protein
MDSVSEYEKKVLSMNEVPMQDKNNMAWLCECAQALAWCLRLVNLNPFRHCDNDLFPKIPSQSDPSLFIEKAELRPISEIQAQCDLHYRMHWYARNCSLVGQESKLDLEIIMERRKALDWVYGVGESWDDIRMDT